MPDIPYIIKTCEYRVIWQTTIPDTAPLFKTNLYYLNKYLTKEEIKLLCRITATKIFGGFLETGGAY